MESLIDTGKSDILHTLRIPKDSKFGHVRDAVLFIDTEMPADMVPSKFAHKSAVEVHEFLRTHLPSSVYDMLGVMIMRDIVEYQHNVMRNKNGVAI